VLIGEDISDIDVFEVRLPQTSQALARQFELTLAIVAAASESFNFSA